MPDATSAATESERLVEQVRALANEVHRELKNAGRLDLSHRISDEAVLFKQDTTTVVLAGDLKRGKSTLLNAMVDAPGLLPVDADVATSVQLAIRHGDQLTVMVTRTSDDDVETFPISPEELVDYASMVGDETKRRGVSLVEVTLPNPLLERGVTLVDTPGLSSMTQGHRDLALAALTSADVLFFCVAADEPVLRTELEFLADAGERIGNVVFVLTKIDSQRDWQRLADQDRQRMWTFRDELLRRAGRPDAGEHERQIAERFARLCECPIIPVSSHMAERARARRQAGHDDRADEFWEQSGIGQLLDLVTATVDRRQIIKTTNVLALVSSLVARCRQAELDTLEGADGSAEVQDRLADEQRKLEEILSYSARWRSRSKTQMKRLKVEVTLQLDRELSAMHGQYQDYPEAVTGSPDAAMVALFDDLERSVGAVWLSLRAFIADSFKAIIAGVREQFTLEGLEFVIDDIAMPDYVRPAATRSRPTQARSLARVAGFSVVEALVETKLNPIRLAMKAGIAVLKHRTDEERKELFDARQRMSRLIEDAIAAANREFLSTIKVQLMDLRVRLQEVVEQRLDDHVASIKARRNELATLAKQEASERARAKHKASEQVDRLGELAERIEALQSLVAAS